MKTEKKIRGIFEKVPGSNVWWIQYIDSDGRRRRECAGTKSAARDLVQKRRNERRERTKMPENFRAPRVTLGELAKKALQYSHSEKRSYRADESRMKNILAEFEDRPAEEITPAEIGDWLRSHLKWTVATRNRHLALIKLVYRLAEEGKKIKFNPARLVHQRKENNARIRFLSAREETMLRAVIEKNYAEHMPEFEIALHTGMRRSEMYGMTWECVDLENRIVTVPRAKNGEVRHVKLNSMALAALRSLHARSIGSGPVFKTQDARYWFEPAVELAN